MSRLAKLERVTKLVNKLHDDQQNETLTPQRRHAALLQLKLEGRDPTGADPIFTTKGISMLLKYAFESNDVETSRGAQRVVANSMVLKPETRRMVLEQGSPSKFCQLLELKEWEDEFLASRIIFLLTYAGIDLKELVETHRLADLVTEKLSQHASQLLKKSQPEPMQDMALVETLKLLFNVTHLGVSQAKAFTPAIPHLVALLWRGDIPKNKPLDGPYGQIVNAILNMDQEDERVQSALFPTEDPTRVLARLIELLDPAIRTYQDQDLEASVTPLVHVLWNSHNHAPEAAKQYLRETLLPTTEDREQVLGRGETLSAKLLSNFSNPMCPTLRDAISSFLFDLSDKDASKFVDNVGYGLASGYLFQHNIPVPVSDEDADASSGHDAQRPINPITGQFLDAEIPDDGPEMTLEEKEREAERLFVLFERLKATGVMDVQNPVEAAMRSGAYRELKDDEVEELD